MTRVVHREELVAYALFIADSDRNTYEGWAGLNDDARAYWQRLADAAIRTYEHPELDPVPVEKEANHAS